MAGVHVLGKPLSGLGLLVLLAFCAGYLIAGEPNTFPATSGYNLDGKKYDVPGDFQGTNNLVIVTFQREQQKDADRWAAAARQIESSNSDFRYYEIAAMERRNSVLRWWWDSFMRKAIREQQTRDRTIIVYVNKHEFRDQLSIPDEKDVHVLLITHSGQILWHVQGGLTEEKRNALTETLSSQHHPQ